MADEQTISAHEADEVARANATGKVPVVFVHGLWLLASSWDRWASGLRGGRVRRRVARLAGRPRHRRGGPSIPRCSPTRASARSPTTWRRSSRGLGRKPAVIGHSFGGLLTQILAGRGLSAASVAIDPAPFRGVLPLPFSALKSGSPVLGNPLNRHRAIPLTYEQFRYAFANAVSEDEAKELHETYAVPGSGVPLFQAAAANLNPWTEAKVDTKNPERGPLLIVSGEKDHTVPWAIANASYKQYKDNPGVTEIVEMPNRGHSLVIDSGWREVCDTALAFVKRFV